MTTLKYKNWTLEVFLDENITEELFQGAVKALSKAYRVPESSIGYLLNNGWKQSLQDAYAGPRSKAVKAKESFDTIQAIMETAVTKRIASIKKGMVAVSGGRDPIISTAKKMLELKAEALGKTLPKDKDELDRLINAWVPKHLDEIKAEIAKRKAEKAQEVTLDDLDEDEVEEEITEVE